MEACKGEAGNCGKYIKQIEAQPWELAVVFIMMAAAIIFVVHFVFFTGGTSQSKPTPKEQDEAPRSTPTPRRPEVPKLKLKEYSEKGVQAVNEHEQIWTTWQTIKSYGSRKMSTNKSRESSPQKGLSPRTIRRKGTSSTAFDTMYELAKHRGSFSRK